MWNEAQQSFLDRAMPHLKDDSRLLGVAAAGAKCSDGAYADMDLILVCHPTAYATVMEEKEKLADRLGHRLAGFTGEDEDERRLVSLYDDPLLHVDLKFVSLHDLSDRAEDPEILWEKDGAVTKALHESKATHAHPDLQWIEDRFWVWMHYGSQKLGRGELFAVIDLLSFLRAKVLGPLVLWKQGRPAGGVQNLEEYGGEYLSALRATVPIYDAKSCDLSLREAAKLYVDLRETLAPTQLTRHRRTEMASMRALHEVSEGSATKSMAAFA